MAFEPGVATIEVIVLNRFFCAKCRQELALVLDALAMFCNSPECKQYNKRIDISTELRRISCRVES